MSGLQRTLCAGWPPVVVYLMLGLGLIFGNAVMSSHVFDQNLFHYQVVHRFWVEWPTPDITNYGVATGPGYHVLLAGLATLFGPDLLWMRLVSLLIGTGFLFAVAGWMTRVASPRTAALLTMPLAASPYVIGSGAHVHTDTAGWACGAAVFGFAVFGAFSKRGLFATSLLLVMAVAVRQSLICMAGPLIFAGLLRSRFAPRIVRNDGAEPTWGPFFGALLASSGGAAVLFMFMWLWGGLVPPIFQDYHAGALSLSALGFGFAVFGLYAPFFIVTVPNPIALFKRYARWLILLAIAGALLVLIPESAPDEAAGRTGGPLWRLAERGPIIANRSLVLAAFAAWGAVAFGIMFAGVAERGRLRSALILACGWFAVLSTLLANTQSFQRYFDLPALLVLAWFSALAIGGDERTESRAVVGPTLLAAMLMMLLMLSLK